MTGQAEGIKNFPQLSMSHADNLGEFAKRKFACQPLGIKLAHLPLKFTRMDFRANFRLILIDTQTMGFDK
jgi:hypothetical protein